MPAAEASALAHPAGRRQGAFLALLGALLLLAFAPTLWELGQYWAEHAEYSHGFLMPVVAAWILWDRRDRVRTLVPRSNLIGVLGLVLSLGLLVLGEMKLSWFLKPYAFVASLASLALALSGWRGLRVLAPALVVLLLMCPLPGRVQNGLTLPLKHGAAVLATGLLDLSGVPATLDGNVIHLVGAEDLWVADACSGIRSLISLVSLAIIACLVWKQPWPLRAVVVASAVPIAVLVNGLRIWGTGMLTTYVSPEVGEGFFHLMEGLLLFGVAALLLVLWAWALGRAFGRRTA